MRKVFIGIALLLQPVAAGGDPAKSPASPPTLTEEQRQWATGRTLRVASDPHFPPFSEFTSDGKLQGIDYHVLVEITRLTGLQFTPVAFPSWRDAWNAFEAGEVDMLTGCAETPTRAGTAHFTASYARSRVAIIAHRQAGQGWSLDDLSGRTLAIPLGYAHLDDIRQRIPRLRIATAASLTDALALVAERKADATLMNLSSAVALLPRIDFRDLRVAGFYDREFPLRLAVHPSLPELVPILNVALLSRDRQSPGAMYVDWVDQRLEEWASQTRALRQKRWWLGMLSTLSIVLAGTAVIAAWRLGRRKNGHSAPPADAPPASGSDQWLGKAFELTAMPMLVVQLPDLILDRNLSARNLFPGCLVLPPELAEITRQLASRPPESPIPFHWGPPGQPAVAWQARLLPLPEGRGMLSLVP
jgi:ABC-type amino acid transport substrate-binding protein